MDDENDNNLDVCPRLTDGDERWEMIGGNSDLIESLKPFIICLVCRDSSKSVCMFMFGPLVCVSRALPGHQEELNVLEKLRKLSRVHKS